MTNTSKTVEYSTYSYEYDSLGRLTRYFETLEDEIVQQVETTYDSKNRAASYAYFDGAQMRSVEYTYDTDKSGVLERYDYGADGALGYDYDALNRVTKKYIRHDAADGTDWTVAYNYKAGSATNQTTSLISQMQYTIGSENYTFNYTYDNLGNITEVTDAGGNTVAKYMYDELNQLQLEEVYNGSEAYTMLYDYDTFGNLLSAKKYSGTGFSYPSQTSYGTLISTETYGYTDASWKDLLTSYNGTSITYDAIGNPLSYYNGQSYTFTWEKGRQLASAVTGGKTVTFEYNADGIRTEKHVSGTADYYYRLDGDKVVEMVKESELGTQRYVFIYDNEGNPHALYYYSGSSTTPTKYYYVLNLQGDVIQLRNSSYAVVANYTYDAWGKLLSVTNANGAAITSSTNIANINPIRYRGYFYDTETRLYYISSRYYDPEIGRFINADGYVSTGQGVLGYNMYAYCGNNPVNRVDLKGQFWKELWDELTQTIQQANSYFTVAAGVSQVDTFVPGPADVASGALLLGGVLVCAGIATYNAITAPATSTSISKVKEAAEAITAPTQSSTVIYRYGGTNPGNLTPKAKDKYSGLSFSTVPKPGAAMTTIEAINATGVVYAVIDGPAHVSVRPVGATMEDWINVGCISIWTQAVMSVVRKWDGGY